MGRKSARPPRTEPEPDSQDLAGWLGAEAHVRYQGKRPGWRRALVGKGPGIAGLTLLAAFVVGLLVGGGAMMLTRPCGRREGVFSRSASEG